MNYEYRLLKAGGGGLFKAGQIDERKSQDALDAMAAEGWRLVSSFVEIQSGNSMNFCTVWEREKKA